MAERSHQNPVRSSDDAESPLALHGVTVQLGRTLVLNGVDLDVRRGEILALIGTSGGGKSVLMRAILGLVPIQSGNISLFGHDIHAVDEQIRHTLLRRCGVLFQNNALFSSLTIAENIEVPLREIATLSKPLQDVITAAKLALAGLSPDVADLYPAKLSGGMRKRAALARAIAVDPELLLLDEPTSGLDPPTASELDTLIRDLSRTLKLTVLVVTHDLDSAYAISDRVAVLVGGQIAVAAPITEVEQSRHPWIQAYFHGPRGRQRSERRRI